MKTFLYFLLIPVIIVTVIYFGFSLFSGGKESNVKQDVILSEPQSTKVFFKNISNGDTLESPFIVEMGVVGMKIKPAGQLETGTGHHHIIIDKKSIKYGEIIPMDTNHLHYGKGDTITSVDLPTGNHKLTLQFANGMHMSYGEQYSNTINVYVK